MMYNCCTTTKSNREKEIIMANSLSVGSLLVAFGPGLLIGTAVALTKAFVVAHKNGADVDYQFKLGGLVGAIMVLGIAALYLSIHIVLTMPVFGVFGDVAVVGLANLGSLAFVYALLTGKLGKF